MKRIDEPTRLRDGDEFGALLRAAEPRPIDGARLERAGAAVRAATVGAAIGVGASAAAASKAAAATAAPGKAMLVAGAIAAAGGATYVVRDTPVESAALTQAASDASHRVRSLRAEAPRPAMPATPAPIEASIRLGPPAPERDARVVADGVRRPLRSPDAVADDRPRPPELADDRPRPPELADDRPRPPEPARVAVGEPAPASEPLAAPPNAPDRVAVAPPAAEPPRRSAARAAPRIDAAPTIVARSSLDEELALYDAARSAAGDGSYAAAVASLDLLLARHPTGLLREDAELTRVDYLARAGRARAAAAAAEAALASGRHGLRRGELERVVGDLRLKLGDCDAARAAYGRAAASGLSDPDRQAIRRGLARCPRR